MTEELLDTREGAVVVDKLGSLFQEPVLMPRIAADGALSPKRRIAPLAQVFDHAQAPPRRRGHRATHRGFGYEAERRRVFLPVSGRGDVLVSRLRLAYERENQFFALALSGLQSDRAARRRPRWTTCSVPSTLADQTRIPINPKGEELTRCATPEEAAKKAAKKAKKARKARMGKDDDAPPGADERLKRRAKTRAERVRRFYIERLKAQAKKFKGQTAAPAGADRRVRVAVHVFHRGRARREMLCPNARKAW